MDYTTCRALKAGSETAYCWTRSETSGMFLLVLASGASGIATLAVYAWIIKRAFQTGKNPVKTRMDVLMISLLFANFLHALGSLLSIKWIIIGYSDVGTYCTVQGVINQIAPVAVAINTIAIALWTFITMWWWHLINHLSEHRHRMWSAVLCIWLIVFLVTATPDLIHRREEHRYWRPTPLWCTISKDYEIVRLLGKYLWFWIAFLSFIVYIPLALMSRGYLTRDARTRTTWLGFTIHRRRNHSDRPEFMIYPMIAYPLSNAILIVPLSIVRWIQLTGSRPIRSRDSIAVVALFDLNGLVNVLLLVYLRPGLFRGGEPNAAGEEEPNAVEGEEPDVVGDGVANGDRMSMGSVRTQDSEIAGEHARVANGHDIQIEPRRDR